MLLFAYCKSQGLCLKETPQARASCRIHLKLQVARQNSLHQFRPSPTPSSSIIILQPPPNTWEKENHHSTQNHRTVATSPTGSSDTSDTVAPLSIPKSSNKGPTTHKKHTVNSSTCTDRCHASIVSSTHGQATSILTNRRSRQSQPMKARSTSIGSATHNRESRAPPLLAEPKPAVAPMVIFGFHRWYYSRLPSKLVVVFAKGLEPKLRSSVDKKERRGLKRNTRRKGSGRKVSAQ